jgi:hypothetical protein
MGKNKFVVADTVNSFAKIGVKSMERRIKSLTYLFVKKILYRNKLATANFPHR